MLTQNISVSSCQSWFLHYFRLGVSIPNFFCLLEQIQFLLSYLLSHSITEFPPKAFWIFSFLGNILRGIGEHLIVESGSPSSALLISPKLNSIERYIDWLLLNFFFRPTSKHLMVIAYRNASWFVCFFVYLCWSDACISQHTVSLPILSRSPNPSSNIVWWKKTQGRASSGLISQAD